MGFTCGIVGLPNAGKTTIFNALTSSKAEAANYLFSTINPNVGIVEVSDQRLEKLAALLKPPKVTPTTLQFIDIAGLVKGASKGEGLGNQFLAQIRNVEALVQVVRCFEDEEIVHPEGSVDPGRDMEIINIELILADLETVEKRLDKMEKLKQSGDKEIVKLLDNYYQLRENLNRGIPARLIKLEEEEKKTVKELNLLTQKPLIYVANISEKGLKEKTPHLKIVEERALKEGAPLVIICGEVEAVLSDFSPKEKEEILKDLDLEEGGLKKLIQVGYHLLGLITFYTTVGPELKAWTIPKGTKAHKAAGKVHSDMERGFIRAEIIPFEEFIRVGSLTLAKEKGLICLEGKDYPLQDGDITYFRFKV